MKISVIVPVRNEATSIRSLLDRLLEQTLKPAEIVITDGGSTDTTVEIIEEYVRRGAPLHLVRTRMALPGRGRNLSAAQACSDWLAFTDAGVVPSTLWLESLAETAAKDESIDVVYGSYEPIVDTLFEECAAIAYVPPLIDIDGTLRRPYSIASALMRKSVWKKAGGFPEHLRSAEDLLFMNRVASLGSHISYAPQAVVRWSLQPGWWTTFKKFAIYSRNNILAGLWHNWQAAIFKRYSFLLLLSLPALFVGWSWLGVVIPAWLAMLTTRAMVAVWRNRRSYPMSPMRNCARLLLVVPLIALLDVATIVGTLNWLIKDKLHLKNGPLRIRDGA
jgi:glycosyltransferase involved in cell wall biosynthesis